MTFENLQSDDVSDNNNFNYQPWLPLFIIITILELVFFISLKLSAWWLMLSAWRLPLYIYSLKLWYRNWLRQMQLLNLTWTKTTTTTKNSTILVTEARIAFEMEMLHKNSHCTLHMLWFSYVASNKISALFTLFLHPLNISSFT